MNLRNLSLLAILLSCITLPVWHLAQRRAVDAPTLPQAPSFPIECSSQKSKSELQAEREVLFRSDVEPIVKEADRLNREAAERCIARLSESFNGYRTGIPPFCREINTWGTRFGVMRRMPSDWWYEKSEVRTFIDEKFAKHLFTDKKLTADIEQALKQFRDEVEANQNLMIIDIRVALGTKDLPNLPSLDYSDFSAELSSRLSSYTERSAKDSVTNGIVVEIASGIGGYAAEQLLAQLLVRISTMVGASTASAGGATAGGAAIGGGSGTLGGPLGTAAGIAAGLVVGGVIDWWMSKNFEAKMTEQLNHLIDNLNDEIIRGNKDRIGLREGLSSSCDVIRQAYLDTIRPRIVEGI